LPSSLKRQRSSNSSVIESVTIIILFGNQDISEFRAKAGLVNFDSLRECQKSKVGENSVKLQISRGVESLVNWTQFA
jgi:hypothetical protein